MKKKAYVLVQWDLIADTESLIAVYLSKTTADAERDKLEAKEKKRAGRPVFSYFVSFTDLIEE